MVRSIPACAGEPRPRPGWTGHGEVYPRVCGGTHQGPESGPASSGLSPRVRGNRISAGIRAGKQRSIPACAGEPSVAICLARVAGVYPRVCGGTCHNALDRIISHGLSPRVRGNLYRDLGPELGRRSIPACAGEPPAPGSWPCAGRVYPRVCGGTGMPFVGEESYQGLSPRVRGNRQGTRGLSREEGSIPACAGEPAGPGPGAEHGGVYPRVCGGTSCGVSSFCGRVGLSPRVRGNRGTAPTRSRRSRSIPACAGEPHSETPHSRCYRVYPRVCGGTGTLRWGRRRGGGLSPRVRGNPSEIATAVVCAGSIPACAGEPASASHPIRTAAVYPRVCGGTAWRTTPAAASPGLSPRVRGNPIGGSVQVQERRSIPACAGEPPRPAPYPGPLTVYPRVCGGTRLPRHPGATPRGLSPRVRGNQEGTAALVNEGGSIPACAGEPLLPTRWEMLK